MQDLPTEEQIAIAFRRLNGTTWRTVLARLLVYGLLPHEAHVGFIDEDNFFHIPENTKLGARVVPPSAKYFQYIPQAKGVLPVLKASCNREYGVRTYQAFCRRDVPFNPTTLKPLYIKHLLDSGRAESYVAKITGTSLRALSGKCKTSKGGPGIIYILKSTCGTLYKIGITACHALTHRMEQLEVGSKVELLGTWEVPSYRDMEKQLHRDYKHLRLPQTEYFYLGTSDLTEIRNRLTHASC